LIDELGLSRYSIICPSKINLGIRMPKPKPRRTRDASEAKTLALPVSHSKTNEGKFFIY